jgi:hypothetical protein
VPGRNHEPVDEAAASRSPELARAEAEIARTREEVSRSVVALRRAVVNRTDWREWVRRNPGLYMAAAFALGLIWGLRPSGRARAAVK